MVELFNNTKNKEMVFNVNAEGIDPSKVEVRMLLVNEGKITSLLFMGDIEDGKVRFELPALVELSEAQKGTMRLEVIADGEYFKPWQSEYQVKTKPTFTVSAPVTESVEPPKKMVVQLETPAMPVIPKKSFSVNEAAPTLEAPKPVTKSVPISKPVVPKSTPVTVSEKVVVENSTPVITKPTKPAATTDDTHIPVSFEDFLKTNR